MALKIYRAEGAREKGLAASSPEAQDLFMESVGMMVTLPIMASEDVLDPKVAEVLSCALRHKRVRLARLRDPYFTNEEWSRVSEAQTDLLDDVLDGIAAATPDQMKRWRGKRKSELCRCIAHSCQDDLYMEVVSELVSIQPPLSDHEGGAAGRRAAELHTQDEWRKTEGTVREEWILLCLGQIRSPAP